MGRRAADLHHLGPQPVPLRATRRTTAPRSRTRPDAYHRPRRGPTGLEYGLGLTSRTLSCGGVYWGHGGDIVGYETRGGITDNGRAVNLAVTALPTTASATQHVVDTVDRALCS